jgi:myo-inositol 2-dehydrogenase / D-chiro-inositol 1-dehydrogenase
MPGASLGLAVIGAGRIGAVHARNVARGVPGAHLVGVADADASLAARVVDEIGAGRVDSVDGLLADPAVAGVIVATPTETHAVIVAEAARSRKHILCEKPISLRLDATRAAIADAAKSGVILQVGFQRRFDEAFAGAERAVRRGDLGSIRFVRLVGRDHRMPSIAYLRTSGGQYRDQMIHEFDTARWLLAPHRVEEVSATGSALVEPSIASFGDVDTSVACLKFDGGQIAVIDDSRETAYGYDVRAEIHGSAGMLLVGHGRFADGVVAGLALAEPEHASFIERFAQAYKDEAASFARAIAERIAPLVCGEDALEALRIAIAADRSLREKRTVRLSEVADD